MKRSFWFVLFLMIIASPAALSQTSTPQVAKGTPPFGSFGGGPDIINLGNLNAHLTIPVFGRAARGSSFEYDLAYDTSIWYPVTTSGTTSWQSVTNWGWTGTVDLATPATGTLTSEMKLFKCFSVFVPTYFWTYVDKSGVRHSFPGSTSGGGGTCNETSLNTYATDGSGYYLQATGDTGTVTWRTGTLIGSAGHLTDNNGNKITVSGSSVFDTQSSTIAAVTVSGSPGSPPIRYAYTNPQGTTSYVTATFVTHTVKTAFGCSNVPVEYNQSNIPLVDKVTMPDGGVYSFTYETTPGYSGQTVVTGRVASISFPTGGSITYTYTGTNHGIVCADGSAAGFTRAVSPGGTWTYTRTLVSGKHWQTKVTTPPDPSVGNDTVIDFQQDSATTTNFYEVQRKVYQGSSVSGTLLLTAQNCYNGNFGSCVTTGVATSFSRIDAYRQLPNGKTSAAETLIDHNTGVVTEAKAYDYGVTLGSAPSSTYLLRDTVIAYASLGGGKIVDHPSQITVKDGAGNTKAQTNYTYDEYSVTQTSGTPQLTTPPNGARGNLTTVASHANGTTTLYRHFTYYDTGMLNNATDLDTSTATTCTSKPSICTTYHYSSVTASCGNAFPTSIDEPMSLSRSTVLNCNGAVPTQVTDEHQQPTGYSYDPNFWRVAGVSYPDGGATTLTYNFGTTSPWNIVASSAQTASVNVTTKTVLDGFGRVTQNQLTSDLGGTDYLDTTYNNLGRMVSVSQPYRAGATVYTTQYTYDALNRLTWIVTPNSFNKYITYTNRAVQLQQFPSWDNQITIYQLNGLGQTAAVCEVTSTTQMGSTGTPAACGLDIAGTGFLTNYTHDALGNLTAVSNADNTRTFGYDFRSRLTTATEPELYMYAASYVYDTQNAGDLYQRIAPAPNQSGSATVTTTYTHDALHRLTQVNYSDGTTPSVTLAYDQTSNWGQTLTNTKGRLSGRFTCSPGTSCGNTSSVSAGLTGDVFSYDSMGRVLLDYQCTPSLCGTNRLSGTYTYNLLGQVATSNDVQGGIVFTNTYNAAAQLTQIYSSYLSPTEAGDVVSGIVYNAAGQPTSDLLGNGIQETWGYDAANNPSSYSAGTVYSNSASWIGSDYVSSATDSVNGNWAYGYDNFERLSSSSCSSPTSVCPGNQSSVGFNYLYDQLGNRWQQNLTAGSGPAPQHTFGTMNHINDGTVVYDSAGNLTNDSFHTYTFDAEGRMTKVDGGATAFYAYNAAGFRVEQGVNSTDSIEYVYDLSGNEVAGLVPGTTNLYTAELFDNGRHWVTFNGDAKFLHTDWRGTLRATTNLSGSTVQQCTDLPFGDDLSCTSSLSQYMGISGSFLDSYDNLDHFLYRQYTGNEGRWISPDPAGLAGVDPTNPQTWNRYAYVANNPISFVDPLGLLLEGPHNTNCTPSRDGWSYICGGCWGDTLCAGGGGGGGGFFAITTPGYWVNNGQPDDPSWDWVDPSVQFVSFNSGGIQIPNPGNLFGAGNNQTPKPTKIHGNWCGPDWTGGRAGEYDPAIDKAGGYQPPKDALDTACMHHDMCYNGCRQEFTCDSSMRSSCFATCDAMLGQAAHNLPISMAGAAIDILMNVRSTEMWPVRPNAYPNPASCPQ